MKTKFLAGVAAIALAPASAMAIGLDRSDQPIDILFEAGNYFELSYGRVFPSIDGQDDAVFGGQNTGDVGDNYDQLSAGIKFQATEKLSFALIADKPYGANVSYGASESIALGGSEVDFDSRELRALARYQITPNYSVHAGLRHTRFESDITLEGAAYGALSGYNVRFEEDSDIGGIVGVAYEKPELALRVALTYFEATEHEVRATESIPLALQPIFGPTIVSTVETQTAEALHLDFQTGLNARTLLFGQVRYAWYDDVISSPPVFDAAVNSTEEGDSLTRIEDNYSISLGIGRAFTEQLSGSLTIGYEPQESDDLTSPLGPTNGRRSVAVGLSYDVTEQITVAGGVSYVDLGDARAETASTARADFEDNHAIGVGLQLGYSF